MYVYRYLLIKFFSYVDVFVFVINFLMLRIIFINFEYNICSLKFVVLLFVNGLFVIEIKESLYVYILVF